jgi:hypothetical protein
MKHKQYWRKKEECKCTLFHKFTNYKHKHKTNYKLPQIFNLKEFQKAQNTHELFLLIFSTFLVSLTKKCSTFINDFGWWLFLFSFFCHLHQLSTFQSTLRRTSCSNKVPNHFWILKWPFSMLQLTLFIPFKFILFSITWSPSSLPFDFSSLVNFYTPLDGIKVLGFPFGSSSFTIPFSKIS